MSKIPYMPLYVGDYEADTAHLTLVEDGVYTRLLRLCWKSPECMIPDDETWLFRKLRATTEDEKEIVRTIVAEFFQRKGGRVFQKRQIEEYNRVSEIYDARSAGGKKSAKVKALKKQENGSSSVDAEFEQNANSDDADVEQCSNSGETEFEQNANTVSTTRTRTRTKEEEKEEEGAQAREPENSNFAESEPAMQQASPPDRRPEPPNLSPGFLDDLRQAVGVPPATPPPYWSSPGLDAHAARWIEVHGLTEDQIIAAARASRGRNPEPPDGPKALDAWIATTAKGLQGAAEVKPGKAPAQPKATTTPTTPEERMKFYAEWINSDKVCPPSVISTHMAAMLLAAKLVTKERLRERGIAA